jgi:hypothetical protein
MGRKKPNRSANWRVIKPQKEKHTAQQIVHLRTTTAKRKEAKEK